MTRVRIDPDLCIGTGDCWRLAPEAFEEDKARGISRVRASVDQVDIATLEEAAFNCPTRAITVEKDA